MSDQDEKYDLIENFQKLSQTQSNEQNRIQDITDQFNKVNIQSDPQKNQSSHKTSEFFQNPLNQLDSSSIQSNIIQVDKRYLFPEHTNIVTYLSENTKFIKEKYVEHCMDNLQSIQEFVENHRQNKKKQQSNFTKKKDDNSNQKITNIQITEFNQQTSQNVTQPDFQEMSHQQNSINKNKPNIIKFKEDPLFQQKFTVTQKILQTLSKFDIQSSTKKVSFLEDALIICLVFQKLQDENNRSQDQYIYIQQQHNYQRSFSAFATRIKVVRNLYHEWTLENLEYILRVLRELPKKTLQDYTLIQQNSIKLPKIK
ncbi:unnamed protein product [Paramecium sonneborni]|uniref:Uncharacterized protein n=1 Tax=Paramecium sonneborni TaxID=65129 RepID=A0A8S1KXU0_9CILI|nr:unnamed protein product [Paramecium sonneborni]